MNPALLLLASQVLVATTPQGAEREPSRGARVTALATVEILPSGTTRDEGEARALVRHRLTGVDRRITIEFE